MKIRTGFVSNSSVSSFVVCLKKDSPVREKLDWAIDYGVARNEIDKIDVDFYIQAVKKAIRRIYNGITDIQDGLKLVTPELEKTGVVNVRLVRVRLENLQKELKEREEELKILTSYPKGSVVYRAQDIDYGDYLIHNFFRNLEEEADYFKMEEVWK